ncbi:hypothetical protein SAMN04488030_2306 [Aliiroseovarius halocynthiae]|uniref:Uncharacterized protein n=1 Tax=Aliiroseovarius halocynthiae TaxID=985055 RepID=A0A545SZP3_9RHOB|nr:hypothetical protein [Aliiroseovarius halocynthiae]TQV70401.1 hypothetical protein FIL88_00410 [Aliiroseovarius halocynthiae]SMR81882.1 hypothetical protein SAMN04488030_2306 [Aliiroseovarius halocynthiae]
MTDITSLTYTEDVQLDRDQLHALYVRFGPVQADRNLNQSLEDLAIWLARLQKARKSGRYDEIRQGAGDLKRIAQRLGMTTLARVARDVAEQSVRQDPAALPATLARLGRVGEHSLIAVWDLQDMSL